MLVSKSVSVGVTATLLWENRLAGEVDVLVVNAEAGGGSTVYVGGAGVTVADGVPLPAGASVGDLDLEFTEGVYGVVAAGTADVRVMSGKQ